VIDGGEEGSGGGRRGQLSHHGSLNHLLRRADSRRDKIQTVRSLHGIFKHLNGLDADQVLVDENNALGLVQYKSGGLAAKDGRLSPSRKVGFKKTISKLIHLNGISSSLAVKLRRYSEVDAERVRSPLALQLSRWSCVGLCVFSCVESVLELVVLGAVCF
jgi:hypothetical protein